MLSRRLGGLAGLAFVGLVGSVNIILGSTGLPRAGASQAQVEQYFVDHGAASAAAASIATVVWLCLAVFGAGLVARLRQEDPTMVESWPLLGLAAVFMQNAIFTAVVATQVALGSESLSAESHWLAWQLHNALFTLNGSSLALILLAFSVAGLRCGLIRRWHAGLGLTAAVLLASSSFTTPFHEEIEALGALGLVGFVLWLVWVATYSLVLLRGGRVSASTRRVGEVVGVSA